MKQILIIMSIFSSIFGMNAQQIEQVKVLLPSDYENAIKNKNVTLIDVRTKREYNSGHINKAINMDIFNRTGFTKKINEINKNTPIYLYCRSGSRSQNAAKLLVKMGFKEIYDLKGGYLNWKNK